MPNIRSSELTETSLTLVGANGATYVLVFTDMVAFYNAASGSAAQKRSATINWIKTNIESTLGITQIPSSVVKSIQFDGDPPTRITYIELGSL